MTGNLKELPDGALPTLYIIIQCIEKGRVLLLSVKDLKDFMMKEF